VKYYKLPKLSLAFQKYYRILKQNQSGVSDESCFDKTIKIHSRLFVSLSLSVCVHNVKQLLRQYLRHRITEAAKDSIQGINGEDFDGYQWNFHIQPSLQTHPYFTPPTIYNQFGGIYPESTDINADSAMDIMIAFPTLKILQNDGVGNFSLFQEMYDGYDRKPYIFDFDLDGFKDLWVSPHFYEQGNDNLFHYDTTIYRGISQIQDINGDGRLD